MSCANITEIVVLGNWLVLCIYRLILITEVSLFQAFEIRVHLESCGLKM